MNDILHDALREATLAVLLGSHEVPQIVTQMDGSTFQGTVTMASAFEERLRHRTRNGDFDELIDAAVELLSVERIAEKMEESLASIFMEGLKASPGRGFRDPEPGWLQKRSKDLAAAACEKVLVEDAELLDALRQRVGADFDRHRVSVTVSIEE